MKILMINSVCGRGSTGRICTDLAAVLEQQGHQVKIAYGRDDADGSCAKYAVKIGGPFDFYFSALTSHLFDAHGRGSVTATKRFLKWADEYNPELLWLHNIHGYYINYPMLFRWIKARPQMKVFWTLHDCWAFTGRCSYFSMANCERWEEACGHCPQMRKYPASLLLDRSSHNLKVKKKCFLGVSDMTIITPSEWLADLVGRSILKDYPVKVMNNAIDTAVFQPVTSSFREMHHLENKKIILGVASPWDERKGLGDFLRLADTLDDCYRIVLVGLSESQLASLPPQVLGITKTNDVSELAAIYSAADVFVNFTYEDNFPTVNLEAQACGTPVISYDTGGSKENIYVKFPSQLIPVGDVEKAAAAVLDITARENFGEECRSFAAQYDKSVRFSDVTALINQ